MSTSVRTYGGWREKRGFGLGSLSGGQTAVGLGAVLAGLGLVLLAPSALPLLLVPAVAIAGLVLVRVRGESLVALASRHVRWRNRVRTGATTYRSAAQLELPDALANVELLDGDVALIVDSARGTTTAMVPVEPQGLEFADPEVVERWVEGWGRWLAHLGYVPDIAFATVTVFSRPSVIHEQGDGLMAAIEAAQKPAQDSRTVISLTLRGKTAEIGDAIGSLAALEHCGMTVLPPMSASEVVGWIRSCYDPQLDIRPAARVLWPDARPTAVEEKWDAYRHDGCTSAVFAWDECPGETVGPHTVAALLAPTSYAKRVVMVFAPVPAHSAAREVDRQAEAAMFRSQYRRRLGRDETARERLDIERARQTATDQAQGSGLVDVTIFAVASAPEDEFDQAAADLHNRAGQARLRLRRAYGEQSAAFAATLGVGFVPGRS